MRVAQLDRASDYGSEGREFESSRARCIYFDNLCCIDKGYFVLHFVYKSHRYLLRTYIDYMSIEKNKECDVYGVSCDFKSGIAILS